MANQKHFVHFITLIGISFSKRNKLLYKKIIHRTSQVFLRNSRSINPHSNETCKDTYPYLREIKSAHDSFSLLLCALRIVLLMLHSRAFSCFFAGSLPPPSRVTMHVAKRDLARCTFFYGNLIIIVQLEICHNFRERKNFTVHYHVV